METTSVTQLKQKECAAANVTDEGVAVPESQSEGSTEAPKLWFAACVKMNCERKVSAQIEALGIETYVPLQTQIRQWSDRKKKVQVVVIPLIVFVRCTEEESRQIEMLSSVSRLMRAPGRKKPAVIPDNQIETLKLLLNQEKMPVEFSLQKIRKGDRVRVMRGFLSGVEGVVVQVENSESLAIEISMIGYAMVKIDRVDVKPL